MAIYIPMRIVPYEQVENLVTMEENSSIVVNLMQETIALMYFIWIELYY